MGGRGGRGGGGGRETRRGGDRSWGRRGQDSVDLHGHHRGSRRVGCGLLRGVRVRGHRRGWAGLLCGVRIHHGGRVGLLRGVRGRGAGGWSRC